MRAHGLGSRTAAPFHAFLEDASTEAETGDCGLDGEGDPAADEPVTHQTKRYMGWKISYRLQEPDKVQPSKHVVSLAQKRGYLAAQLDLVPEGVRSRSTTQIQIDAEAKATKTSERRNGEGACFQSVRLGGDESA